MELVDGRRASARVEKEKICAVLAWIWIAIQLSLAVALAKSYSCTIDESAHLPAGLAVWCDGDFSLYSVNPPIPRSLATAPLVFDQSVSLAALSLPRTRVRPEFELATLFSELNRDHFHQLVFKARLMSLVWLLLASVVVKRFAEELYGAVGALLVTIMWASQPFVISHGALITADMAGTAFCLLTVYSAWKWRITHEASTYRRAIALGGLVAAAILTKFTNLLLLPILAIAVMGGCCNLAILDGLKRLVVFGFAVVFVIWLGYGFNGIGKPIGEINFRSDCFKSVGTSVISDLPSPLPPSMFQGIDLQQRDFERGRSSYLRGELRSHGWWYYYVYGLGVKLTLGLLVAGVIGMGISVTHMMRSSQIEGVEIPVALMFFLTCISFKSSYTDHVRYALPVVPLFCLCAGRICVGGRRMTIFVFVLALASVLSAASQYPHWLGYFNESIGSRENGWKHLARSNVDWGQDLIYLADWLVENPDRWPVKMVHNHYIDASIYLPDDATSTKMTRYVVVDTESLIRDPRWNQQYPVDARIGSSFFVFDTLKSAP